ncbi:MAG: rod shape-determining protein MreD [Syntrophaceae bacterium]|nr:rod shape-determining protein MreD [Syntrophaceae bacterium]
MKRILLPLFLGVIFLTLQTTLLTSPPIRRIRPDIVLVLTVYLGFFYPAVSGGVLAVVIGILMDLFSGNSFGLYTVSRPLIFYVSQFFKGRFYLVSFWSHFLIVLIFGLAEGLLLLLLLGLVNSSPLGPLYRLFFTSLFPQSFFTALLAPILFFLIHRLSLHSSVGAG